MRTGAITTDRLIQLDSRERAKVDIESSVQSRQTETICSTIADHLDEQLSKTRPLTPLPPSRNGRAHGHNAFIRDGDQVYRTYFINGRGDEALGTVWSYLDMTALGRQEEWEDSPEGYPQTPPYRWWRWHDQYASQAAPGAGRVAMITDPDGAAIRRVSEAK